jgi:hypothetical protein
MPSSSARCSQLPRAVDKLPFYVALKKLRDHLRGRLPQLDLSEVVFRDVELRVETKRQPAVDEGVAETRLQKDRPTRAANRRRLGKRGRADVDDGDSDEPCSFAANSYGMTGARVDDTAETNGDAVSNLRGDVGVTPCLNALSDATFTLRGASAYSASASFSSTCPVDVVSPLDYAGSSAYFNPAMAYRTQSVSGHYEMIDIDPVKQETVHDY